jgi:CheY-like chemotaxis protein
VTHDSTVIPIMRGRLVLVTERFGTPRVLVPSYVRALGYPAKPCSTGTEAPSFLSLHPAAFSASGDLSLPDMDGGEVIEPALDLVPRLRVVVMVAPGDQAVADLLPG